MLEKVSIEWKLPLAICTVLMAVVITLSLLAHHEVAASAQRAAALRVENFASQLAGTFHASVDKGLVRLTARASREPLIDYLRSSDRAGSASAEALTALDALLVPIETPVDFAAVELWDLDRRRLLAVGPDRERIAALPVEDLVSSPPRKTGRVGSAVTLGDRVVVPAFVPVLSEEEPLGYLVRWSYMPMSAEARAQIIGFLAPEASAYLGTPGGLWIDWERVVPQPPLDLTRLGTMELVQRPEGVQLAAAARIPDTPWIVVVEYPERLVLAPARRLFGRVGVAAIFLLLAGLAGVWVVARRISGPLRELTLASESLAGDSRADVGADVREDEVGRLRRSFQRMSERVQEAHRRLEAKVGELRAAQELEQAARGDAEAANSRKDEFLAMLAHELRNPLSPIVCALAVVRSSRASETDREEALAVTERQVRNITRIVDDLLDVSRITRGKIELKLGPCDVGTLVRNALETSQPLLEAKRHHVQCILPEKPLTLLVDETRLEQVLGNLLTNAAKYTEPGGRIWVRAGREEDEVVFRVRDDGIGIPSDKLAPIFDLFHQVDHSIDRSRGGLGIGLTLVRKLVELHGGCVTAYSPGPGQGSEFVVRIPAGARALDDAEAPAPARVAREAFGAPHVPHVDNGHESRDAREQVLELDGQGA